MIKPSRIKRTKQILRMRYTRNSYTILFGNPKDKASTKRFTCPQEDNIQMYIKEIRHLDVERNYLAQDRAWWRAVANTIINIWETQKTGIFLARSAAISVLSWVLFHKVNVSVIIMLLYSVSCAL